MRTRLLLFLAPMLLVTHLLLNFFPSMKGIWSELYLYNAIALTAIAVVMSAPRVNDRFAQPLIAAAIGLWLIGSLVSSISSYFLISAPTQLLSNMAYLLFYPLAMLALPRLLSPSRKFSTLEIFDASIVGLGLTTLGTTFFLHLYYRTLMVILSKHFCNYLSHCRFDCDLADFSYDFGTGPI